MEYSLLAFTKLLPDVQLVGGHFVLHIDGKNVHLGTYTNGGSVTLTCEGHDYVSSLDTVKPKSEKSKKRVEVV